nr:hypothetical protein [Tanacetum cinerariifolium]
MNADGLKVCSDKVKAVLNMPSSKCLKDVQRLNGKLASLTRFLSKSAKKSLPFFKTLKKCTKKSELQWTAKAEIALRQMKKSIAELPMLTAPEEKEELITYLSAAKEAISAVLMMKRDVKQMPVYFISRALQGEHDIHYRSRTSIKGQILADFIMECPEDDSPDTPMEDKEELPDPWILFTDELSCTDGSGARLILTNPEGMEFTYALRFRFEATKNEAEYEALIAGHRIAGQMGAKNLKAHIDLRLVANQVNGCYVAKEPGMIQYLEKVRALTSTFKEFSIKQVPIGENKKENKLSKITSTSFTHLRILPDEKKKARAIRRKAGRYIVTNGVLYKRSFLGPWLRCVEPLQANYVLREIHEGSCSMHAGPRSVMAKALRSGYYWPTMHMDAKKLIRECNDCQAKPVVTITGAQIKKFVWDNIVCRIDLPGEIVSDNEKQFRDNPFKTGGEGIKARLDERCKHWMEEISHVLWAHQTMIKSSTGETPFSLTYGTKAVIPVEIGMQTWRTVKVDMIKNDEALEINLDLLE